MLLIQNFWTALLLMLYTTALPFICITLWFSKSDIGKSLRTYFATWHYVIFFSTLVFIYYIFAQRWAANLINEIFLVDAGHLSITHTLLTFLYIPLAMIYKESLLANLKIILLMLSIVLVPFLWLRFCLADELGIEFKIDFYSFFKSLAIIPFLLFFLTIVSTLLKAKSEFITEFALWADFNNKHLCTNSWSLNANSVLFLGGNQVLVYQDNKPKGESFLVEQCDFKRKF